MSGFIGICVSVVFSLFFSTELYAANPFQLGQVDYFHQKVQTNSAQENNQDFDWNEHGYLPPSSVLTLLDHPTPENARAYLAWQRLKVNRIIKAQQAIDQALKEEEDL